MNNILAFLICISSVSLYAQGQADNWYFGRNAGISFNTSPPSALTDGQLDTNEGCSSISDVNGNLLMYTDGRTIWNRNHEVMPNADYFNGTGLNGDPSSTSSGLIVPHPTEPNLYFVFTIDEPHHENAYAYPNPGPADSNGNPIPFYTDTGNGIPQEDDGFNNGLNYSIVDMSLNGGLGDVISDERNNELITYDPNDSEEIKYKASEKITAVRGRDCNSVWVITQFRNKFYAFFIDENGIEETPVISTVEPLLEITNYRRAALGYLKASAQGNKLLIAHNTTTYNPTTGQDFGDGNVYLHDFDNLTGQVSNSIELIDNVNAYGVEFSQDGTKAYATVNDPTPKIYQWNLSSNDVFNSIEFIADINQVTGLQLGPDARIYHSIYNSSKLGVIKNPDEIGEAANYTQNLSQGAIALNGRLAIFGLPPFIQSLFSKRIPIIETTDEEVVEQVVLCDTYTYTLKYENIPGATYTWSKDGEVLLGETDYFLDITVDETIEFPVEENYRLEVDPGNGECPLIGVAQVTFNQSPNYTNDQLLACKEVGVDAVFDLTEIREKLSDQAQINPDKIDVKIYRSLADATSETNPIQVTPNFENSENLTSLFVDVSTFDVCSNLIEFELITQALPVINTANERITYCIEDFPETITLEAFFEGNNPDNYDFIWSTSETSQSIEINQAGIYTVEISDSIFGCSLIKEFEVRESNMANFHHTVERFSNLNNTVEIIINPSSLGDYEFAINNPIHFQESNTFEHLTPGIYKVFVRDNFGCGISEKTIGVLGLKEYFTPNGDGINEVWKMSGLLANNQEDIVLQVFDRYGKLLISFTSKDRGWDGTFNGKPMPTDDYWYRVRLHDGTVETGNFTLKR